MMTASDAQRLSEIQELERAIDAGQSGSGMPAASLDQARWSEAERTAGVVRDTPKRVVTIEGIDI